MKLILEFSILRKKYIFDYEKNKYILFSITKLKIGRLVDIFKFYSLEK